MASLEADRACVWESSRAPAIEAKTPKQTGALAELRRIARADGIEAPARSTHVRPTGSAPVRIAPACRLSARFFWDWRLPAWAEVGARIPEGRIPRARSRATAAPLRDRPGEINAKPDRPSKIANLQATTTPTPKYAPQVRGAYRLGDPPIGRVAHDEKPG